MDIKDRIRQVMEDRKMTQNEFALFIQQSPGTLSSIFNGRTRPTLNIVDAIKRCIPDISVEWLMYGDGTMYKTHPSVTQEGIEQAGAQVSEQSLPFDNVQAPTKEGIQPVGQSAAQLAAFHHGVNGTHMEITREDAKYLDISPRKVTEIRVYYDDQTYETFVPVKK